MTVKMIINMVDTEGFDYGTVWSEDKLIGMFDITRPDVSGDVDSILKNVKKFELDKMSAYLTLNEQLLSVGKCFIQEKGLYRVPLISEMVVQIDKYYKSSNRKFKRAEKLRKSFSNKYPVVAKEVNDKVNRTNSLRSAQDKAYSPMDSNASGY